MAIKSGQTAGAQDLGASSADTVLHNISNRTVITAAILYNDSGANATVEFYDSPDNTSAAGKLLQTITLADDEEVDITAIIGQGYAANIRVIGLVTTAGLSSGDLHAKITYTLFTGDS